MNENLAKYRRFLKIPQKTMATVAGCCLTSYNSKERGNKEFTQKEIFRIFKFIKKQKPEVTIEELFFNDEC